MLHRLVVAIMALLLAACQAQMPVSVSVPQGTPVSDLPVSLRQAQNPQQQQPTPVSDAVITAADAEYLLLTNLYQRVSPAVVNIEADMPMIGVDGTNTNRGSGFIYDLQGHIVTSAHVIANTETIRVTFHDGTFAEAQRVGIDRYSDLGVVRVRVESARLAPLTFIADSDQVQVGQRAIAIGNPFGLNSSMTMGIVSGIGRALLSAELIDATAPAGFQNPNIIQTDAPINPGSSGAPLLNSYGEVIGVASAIRSDNGVFQGVGFAVPANTVQRVVPELIAKGRVDYAWMGISVQPEQNGYSVAALAEALNLPVSQGVLLRGVTVGSPADDAGLQGGTRTVQIRGKPVCIGGDIIVAVNGQPVTSMDQLVRDLTAQYRPGDRLILLVVRAGSSFEVALELRPRPATDGTVRGCEG